MKIILTGTHLTPALAVIEEFKNKFNAEIIYIGRSSTMEGDKTESVESKILNNLGIKFLPLISGRLQRSFTIYTIPSLIKIPFGFFQAMYYLLTEKPEIILSFGGYLSVPVVTCAWLLNIPIIIHEQTLVSGLANSFSGLFADKIAISFEKEKSFNNKKIIFTGNPIRSEILKPEVSKDIEINQIILLAKKEKKPLILITGGNQGSRIINKIIFDNLKKLTEISCVIHQTGDSKYLDFEKLTVLKKDLNYPDRYLVRKWIETNDFGFLISKIDLTVSRSGINTLQEMAFYAVPTLVIPLPYLPKDEQGVNARYFEKLGLVKIIYQKDLTSENFITGIKEMLNNLTRLKKKAKKTGKTVIPEAASILALETILLLRKF